MSSSLITQLGRSRFTDGNYSADKYEEQRRHWGGGVRGNKSTEMLRKRAKASGQSIAAATAGKL